MQYNEGWWELMRGFQTNLFQTCWIEIKMGGQLTDIFIDMPQEHLNFVVHTWFKWNSHSDAEHLACGNNYLSFAVDLSMLHIDGLGHLRTREGEMLMRMRWCVCWWRAIMSKAKLLGVRILLVFDMTHPNCPTFPHQISNLFSHYSDYPASHWVRRRVSL